MKFVKAGSVFADWQDETPLQAKLAVSHDLELWKLEKIVDEPDEQERVRDIII